MRVFAISDLHTDHSENMVWLEQLASSTEFSKDIIIVAGDITDDMTILQKTLECLKSAFKRCFFCIGNHELWIRRAERNDKYDSIAKLNKILELCASIGVETSPSNITPSETPKKLFIVPLWSWYHSSFDKEPDVPNAHPIEKIMMDFHACTWPNGLNASGDDSLARYFDAMNDSVEFNRVLKEIQQAKESSTDICQNISVISFSHFLPTQKLLPSKRWLHFPNLAKACGSDYLASRIQQVQSTIHVFGHTHFLQDDVINGVRYIQWPVRCGFNISFGNKVENLLYHTLLTVNMLFVLQLGYPKERMRRLSLGASCELKKLWDSDDDTFSAS